VSAAWERYLWDTRDVTSEWYELLEEAAWRALQRELERIDQSLRVGS
jgi:hypothetical protein